MIKLLTALYESFKELNPVVSLVLGICTFTAGVYAFVNEMWGYLMAKLIEFAVPDAIEGDALSGFAFLNHCFPVQETFAFLGVYCTAAVFCLLFRLAKSFIPTIN